jgi:hypothetical protein
MPNYFEFKSLAPGYRWEDLSSESHGYRYALEVLNIPGASIESVKCYPDASCLGILLKEDARMIRSGWFHGLVQTHSYLKTDYNLMIFY